MVCWKAEADGPVPTTTTLLDHTDTTLVLYSDCFVTGN